MVGLVLVSHSKKLAEAVRDLVLQMAGRGFPVAVASGVGNEHAELGTDAVHISEVLRSLDSADGILVLMDLGSAVLSAQTAVELLDAALQSSIRLSSAPLVEGAIAAAVRARAGGTLDEVAQEAASGLVPKQQQLQPEDEVIPRPAAAQPLAMPDGVVEFVLDVENPHGLHARPAAELVKTASRFHCDVEIANLSASRGPVSARSLTSISLLQVRKGDRIKVICRGPECRQAREAIMSLAAAGFADKLEPVARTPSSTSLQSEGPHGFPGADGIAVGPLVSLQFAELPYEEPVADASIEIARLTTAISAVSDEIQSAQRAGTADAILEAQALILSDPVILDKLPSALQSGKVSAARAWTDITQQLASEYEAMADEYLRERSVDIRDIAARVHRHLRGADAQSPISPATPSIVFTEELLPSQASLCDPSRVLGVISKKGSATSHSAILLRTLGIPMVVGAAGISDSDAGKIVALDGATGELWLDPDSDAVARLRHLQQVQTQRKRDAESVRADPSITLDGTRIEILANVGNSGDAMTAEANGAEGIGLLTEFLFLSRLHAPTEDDQAKALSEICGRIRGPIIVRTLDVGADKPLAFLPHSEERNPYLGIRGIRLSLQSPGIFLPHLRAILRSGVGHDLWVMFPMISLQSEVKESLHLLEQAHQELQSQNIPHVWPIKRGIMIEVPSAALLADELAAELDFFSIGTNDLTQYTMAAERGNASVANLQDALHPAVLRLIKMVISAADARHRHVSICGDAASDPVAAAVFAGLGIRNLSVRPGQAAEIKALFRGLRLSELQETAEQALHLHSATDVRRLAAERINCSVSAK